MRRGVLFEFGGRVMKVDSTYACPRGINRLIVSRCLTPLAEDEGRIWWTIEMLPDQPLQELTVH